MNPILTEIGQTLMAGVTLIAVIAAFLLVLISVLFCWSEHPATGPYEKAMKVIGWTVTAFGVVMVFGWVARA